MPVLNDRAQLNRNLTKWSKRYAPSLLRMTSQEWYTILSELVGMDLYLAARIIDLRIGNFESPAPHGNEALLDALGRDSSADFVPDEFAFDRDKPKV